MPVTQAQAEQVHAAVRSLFKNQYKSSNKAYLEIVEGLPLVGTKSSEGRAARERKRASGDPLFPEMRTGYLHALQHGIKVFAQPDGARIGNCDDMACAAGYFARFLGIGVPWVARIGAPGDHAFCILGTASTPKFTRVRDVQFDYQGSWVVDPWANTCCPLRDYPEAFSRKMDKWTADGKRIWCFLTNAWIAPSDEAYIKGFLTGPLRYEKLARLPAGMGMTPAEAAG